MISIKQRRRLERAVKRLVAASIAESWSGAKHPDELPEINAELRLAKQALKVTLDKLSEPEVKR